MMPASPFVISTGWRSTRLPWLAMAIISFPESVMETIGFNELTFNATLNGGGGGSAGAIGLARAAIRNGDANYVVTVMALQQANMKSRLGNVFNAKPSTPETAFMIPSGLGGPGQLMANLARRHMHEYGTRREAFAEIAITQRKNAMHQLTALKKTPLSLEDYFAAPMISDPLCTYDFCMESDGAVAVITTSTERAKDLKQAPVRVLSAVHGGVRQWGRAFTWMNMPSDIFASSGHRSIAKRLFDQADLTPSDVDVALIYDHFTPMVIMQLEDYGFCNIGEGGSFVESGAIRMDGSLPINPMGGQLSDGYIVGMTHILEGVKQIRGSAANQVAGADVALVTGGPAFVPISGLLLGKMSMSGSIVQEIPGEYIDIAMDVWTAPFWEAAKEGRLVRRPMY